MPRWLRSGPPSRCRRWKGARPSSPGRTAASGCAPPRRWRRPAPPSSGLPRPGQGGAGDRRNPGSAPLRPGRGLAARSRRPELGRARRRRDRRPRRAARPADQQRGRDGDAADGDRRRLRAAVRDQPPRPFRAHRAGCWRSSSPPTPPGSSTSRAWRTGRARWTSRTSTGSTATRAGPPTGARSWPTCCSPSSSTGACASARPRRSPSPATPATRRRTCSRPDPGRGRWAWSSSPPARRQRVPRPERRDGCPADALRGDLARCRGR